jgi:LPS O-antigen subunit length determinant protein (WzzB/FepE family)
MQNNDPTPTSQPDDEISFLDILVVLSENFKLLVIWPILVAAAAYGIASLLPKTYESTAWLRPVVFQSMQSGQSGQGVVANLTSQDTFRAFLQSSEGLKWSAGLGGQEALAKLQRALKASYTAKQDYVSVSITASTPAQAQASCQALIQLVLESLKPTGQLKSQITAKIELEKKSLKEMEEIYTKLSSQLESQASTAQGDKLIESLTTLQEESLTTLQERKNGLQNSLLQLENQLAGYGQEILLQQPTLPDKPISPKKFQITLISGMLTGFVVLVWAFLRAALRAASDDPECVSKLARIRKSFSF